VWGRIPPELRRYLVDRRPVQPARMVADRGPRDRELLVRRRRRGRDGGAVRRAGADPAAGDPAARKSEIKKPEGPKSERGRLAEAETLL